MSLAVEGTTGQSNFFQGAHNPWDIGRLQVGYGKVMGSVQVGYGWDTGRSQAGYGQVMDLMGRSWAGYRQVTGSLL